MGGLSLAADLGVNNAMETGLGAAIIAVRIARVLQVSDIEASDVYYASLLRYLGCTISAHEAAGYGAGDDLAFHHALAIADFANPADVSTCLDRHIAPKASPARRRAALKKTLASLPQISA